MLENKSERDHEKQVARDWAATLDTRALKMFALKVQTARLNTSKERKPRPNYKHCHGRGVVGYKNKDGGAPLFCRCLRRKGR